jgi:hypothetical protein
MNNDTDFLDNIIKNLKKFSHLGKLGEEMQQGTRLAKTDKGARTNARIEAAQKNQGFNETKTSKEELDQVEKDITDELLKRAVNDIFRI